MGRGSFKSSVGLMSLWVSQVYSGSLKFGGVGWVLNQCGSWRVVVGCGGSGAKDCDGSACKPWRWMCGDRFFFFFLVFMWWLFLVDMAVGGGF